jgi:hypothetical protein
LVLTFWLILKWDQYVGLKNVSEQIFVPMYGFWYYEQTLHRQVCVLFTILLVVGLFASSVIVLAEPRRNWIRGFLVLALLSVFAMAHLTSSIGWHTFSGILPLLAAVTAVGVFDLLTLFKRHLGKIGPSLTVIVLGVSATGIAVNYGHARWGMIALPPFLSAPHLESCTENDWVCPRYPVGGDWYLQQLLGVIVSDARCRDGGCRLVNLSTRPAYFSEEPLSSALVQYFPQDSRLPSEAFYPQRTVEVQRLGSGEDGMLNWLVAEYTVFLSDGQGRARIDPGPYWGSKALETAFVEWLAHDMEHNPTSPYRVAFHAALPSGAWVTLARREREITPNETRDIINALQLPPQLKVGLGEPDGY